MTLIRPDRLKFASFVDTFINYENPSSTLTVSGSVGAGATVNFDANIAIPRANTLFDVYAINNNTGKKMTLLAGSKHHPFQATGAENEAHSLAYTAGNLLVRLSVFNGTGAPIALTTQVWRMVAVLYDVPYS